MKKPRLQHNHIFLLNNDTNDKNAGDDNNDNVKYIDAVNKNDFMIKESKNYAGSISISGQLPTYPSPNPTLTLACYQLTVVELGEG